MTYIKKMKMHGFKSFAKPIDLPFSEDFSVVIGPNGSGKSCHFDTIVTLSDGTESKIGDLVEEKLRNNINQALKDGVYCDPLETLEIISINAITLKQEIKKVSKFIRREGEELYHLKTSLGKNVKATGCHPVMIFRNGELKSTLIKDLKKDDLIAAPRLIKIKETSSFDQDKSRLLGYIIGDGYIAKDRIEFVNQDKEILNDFKYLLNKIYNNVNLKERYEKNATRLYVRNPDIVEDIRNIIKKDHLGSITSEFKSIPNSILNSNKEVIRNILAGLYDTDGSVRKDIAIIEFCSKNKILTQQVQRLLLRFGIISKVKKRINYAFNTENKIKRPYWYLYIYGQENLKQFYIDIPLKCKCKRQAIENQLNKNKIPNPNNDLLPKEINLNIKKLTQLLGIKIKNERKKYPTLTAYYENRCHPTRQGIKQILGFFENKLNSLVETYQDVKQEKGFLIQALSILNIPRTQASVQIGLNKGTISNHWVFAGWKGKQENLQNLSLFIKSTISDRLIEIQKLFTILQNISNSDIYWEKIVSIEKTEKVPYVYDLMVQDNHNFIGDGIFVHNSNIVDSLCFVLGRLSSKSMRAENLAKLIYNGGKKGNPAKEAYVSITFDNENNSFPVKAKEIEIKRLIRHNGQSKYFINGELRTRQQIVDLLAAAKINPDGHNIILQGDIVHTAQMPPEERRKIVEDISGISVYEERKEKANRELERVDSRLKEANIVLTERGTYLKELKKDYDQASKYKELEKNVNRNKATFLNIQIKQKEDRLNKITSTINENQSKVDSINKSVEDFKKELEGKKNELNEINENIKNSGETSQQALHKEVESLKDSLNESKTRFSTLKNEVSSITERSSQLSSSITESSKKVSDLEKEKSNFSNEIKSLQKEKEKISLELLDLKKKYNLEELENSLVKLDREIDSVKSSLDESSKFNLLREKDRIEIKLGNLNEVANKDQLKKLSQLKQDFKKSSEELLKLNDSNSVLLNQLSSARIKLQELQEKEARLKARKSLAKESSSYNLAINKIKSLNMQGVYGTISELAQVPSRYAMAVEIAAGSRINSIVVKDDSIAAKCIDYLKKNKLGTAIFLPLNKLKPVKKENLNQGHGLAIDLIKFDSKFKDAFSYVFGNTLVVDDIESARKLGIGKYRMVTLDGDLVETSGAMIGGFRRQRASSFLEPDIDKKLNDSSSEIKRLRSLILNFEKKRADSESNISELRDEKSNFEGEMIKIQASMGNVEDIEKEKLNLSKQLKDIASKLSSLDSDLSKRDKVLKELNSKRALLKEKIEKKRSPELIKKIESLEKSEQKIIESVITLNSDIKNINTQINEMILPEKESMSKIIKKHSDELNNFNNELKGLELKIKEETNLIKEKEKQEANLYSNFRGMLSKRDKLNELIQKTEIKSLNEENKTQVFFERINNLSIDKAKIISEIQGLREQFLEFKDVPLRKGLAEPQLKDEISKFESMMKNLGNVNLRALEIYNQVNEEHRNLTEKSEKLRVEKEDVVKMINEIEGKKTDIFMKTYGQINKNFEAIFSQLTAKGTAHLILENPEKPLEGGIQIMVKIAQNKYLDIKSLSGGEKTLTALSFIFAIQEHDPAPFYLLDEVDAALDKKNSEKLSELVKKYSQKAQYIMISHNDSVITGADKLYGVSMHQDGISHVVSLKI